MKPYWPCLVCLIAALDPFMEMAQTGELPRFVSVTSLANRAASGSSYAPTVSPDGRFVVFVSNARNLTTNDDLASYLDVFLADRASGAMTLVSVNTNGVGGGNDDSGFPVVSTNGQFVAFASAASNLFPNDTNGVGDVFQRDLIAGTTRLVSVGTGGLGADGASTAPLLSADGRWVVFESKAANLVPDDTNRLTDLFARDMWSNVTVVVSLSTNGLTTANGKSDTACLTPDGRFVAFASTATDLAAADANSFADVYVRDLQTNRCTVASASIPALLGAGGDGYRCFHPALSADGRFVAFKAALPAATNAAVFRYDQEFDAHVSWFTAASVSSWPRISDDGRWVASETGNNVALFDADALAILVVSTTTNGVASTNGVSINPVMTPDGRRIAFVSTATDLVAGLTNMPYTSPPPNFYSTFRPQIFLRDVLEVTNRLVTVNRFGQGTETLNSDAIEPSLSADGNVVCFESVDGRLVVGDANKLSDVFARDVSAGETQLVSARDAGRPSATAAARASAAGIFTKPGGGTAVFTSLDSNLAENDDNTAADLFMRDLAAGSTFPALANTNGFFETNAAFYGVVSSNGNCAAFVHGFNTYRFDLRTGIMATVNVGMRPFNSSSANRPLAISSDGQRVVFHAANTAVSSYHQVYVRDMAAGSNRLISIVSSSGYPGNGHSVNPLFTADNRWIVFQSDYGFAGQTEISFNNPYLFAANLSNGLIRLLSTSETGAPLKLGSFAPPALSANARHVAFYCTASNAIYRHDLAGSATNVLVCTNGRNPSISGDGRLVAYETKPPAPAVAQVFVKDLHTGGQELISNEMLTAAGGNGASTTPQISPDGRFVVFVSRASDLVAGDTNGCADIFVRDRILGTTTSLSINRWGNGPGNGASTGPIFAADGRTVLFHSLANDLIEGDYNDRRDVFTVRLGDGDADKDNLDDDWEMAYFNTLDRDGCGDFDGDGFSDRSELAAGTDPTNQGSVLRILTATLQGGSTMLSWSAVPGRRYQIQFKDGVGVPHWSNLGAAVTATTASARAADTTAGAPAQRYYRVVLAP